MITVISGGKASLKLIKAFRNLLYDNEISVLSNTSDSLWKDGNLLCPDLDDAVFLFSGQLNTLQWTGVKGDTFSTDKLVEKITGNTPIISTGDKARAVCIARSNILREGKSLTDAAESLCSYFNITSKILPVTDSRYAAFAEIDNKIFTIPEFRKLYSYDYTAEFRASVSVDFKKVPKISDKAADLINCSDAIIIGPENMNTVISPVLACRDVRKLLKSRYVISVIPKIPADYTAEKYPAWLNILKTLVSVSDIIIQDIKEENTLFGAVRLNTDLGTAHKAESLAWEIMSIIRSRSN
ncbi:MAG: 2-phospho-L-lactate transferase CofD family protein [Methanomicrobium sp.]|nr:2-phospho-L-lactate transferase CofD family protein [Methanomicrobium sp.]